MRKWRFDRFELDERSGQLLESGQLVPLQPKLYELLVLLVEHPGRLFSREELLEHLWKGVHVTDASLSQAIARLRRVLGEELLQTERGRGYRLRTDIQTEVPVEKPRPARPQRGLYGRDAELASLADGLSRHGLVWLSGPPGIGRTTVALAAAERSGRTLLSAELTPELGLQRALHRNLRLSLSGERAADAEMLGQALGARGELLVLIDDAHHDPEAFELIALWQRQAPRILWIVTSRERGTLGQSVALGPLAIPSAVTLLSDRAGVPLRPEDPTVVELVSKLDANPLALCLAAPRLRILQPGELLSRLSGRFELLRHAGASLSAALGAAWSALDERAHEDLQMLAALGTHIPLELAEDMLGGGIDSLERLQMLLDTSWVWMQLGDGGSIVVLPYNQGAWIALHLPEERKRQALAAAWAWIDARADTMRRALNRDDPATMTWLLRHVDLLCTLTAHVPADRDPYTLTYLAMLACELRGEPREVHEEMVARVQSHPGLTPSSRIKVMLLHGVVLCRRSPAQGAAVLREAVLLAEGDTAEVRARCLTELTLALSQVDPDEAMTWVAQTEQAAEESGVIEMIAFAAYARAVTERSSGRSPRPFLTEILARPGIEKATAHVFLLGEYGQDLLAMGHLEEAENIFLQTVAASSPTLRPGHQGLLGRVWACMGRFEEAHELYEEALERARWFGQLQHALMLRVFRAHLLVAVADLAEAERELAELIPLEMPPTVRSSVRGLHGLLALRQGRNALAVQRFAMALADRPQDIELLALASIAHRLHGDLPQAEQALQRALSMQGPDHPVVALALAWAHGDEEHMQRLDRVPGPGRQPLSRRLMEMSWLRPDRWRS